MLFLTFPYHPLGFFDFVFVFFIKIIHFILPQCKKVMFKKYFKRLKNPAKISGLLKNRFL